VGPLIARLLGAFALPALCCAHTPAPSAPADGAVFVAWVDGKALGAAPDSPLAAGAYRPLATVVDVVAPGLGPVPAIGAIDAAGSAGVLSGGAAWLLVGPPTPSTAGARIATASTRLVVHANGADAAARVRAALASAGTTSSTERPLAPGSPVIEFNATWGEGAPLMDAPMARVDLHRAAVLKEAPKGDVCAQVYVDLNALRRSAPDAMDATPLARVAATWGLANGRDAMISIRTVKASDVSTRDPNLALPPGAAAPEPYAGPTLARVDVSWSARSEEPTVIHAGPIAAGFWGAGKDTGVQAGAPWAAAVRCDVGMWTLLTLRTYGAGLATDQRAGLSRAFERWAGNYGEAADRLVRASAGWLVLWPRAGETGAAGLDWCLVPHVAMSGEQWNSDAKMALVPFPGAASADDAGVRVATARGLTVGFARSGAGVIGRVEFAEDAVERVRASVAGRVQKK
jgi:hypothetical protein